MFSLVYIFPCRGHGGLSLDMPTKLWELTGRETGRSFLYLQQKWSAWALDSAACGQTFAVGFTCQAGTVMSKHVRAVG